MAIDLTEPLSFLYHTFTALNYLLGTTGMKVLMIIVIAFACIFFILLVTRGREVVKKLFT